MQPKKWLTRGDRITILHKPLDDDAAVGRTDRHLVAKVLDHPDRAVARKDGVGLNVLGANELALPR